MRVAPEGWPFIIIAWLVAAILAWFHLWIPLVIWLPVAIWVIAFYRDPTRDGPRGEELLIAPADGKVVSVIAIDEPAFLGGPATRVSIFMNVFDVHVNRYPASGKVCYRLYSKGKFGHAMPEKASTAQKRELSGVITSSIRMMRSSLSRPNSNLVSAMMMPWSRAIRSPSV